MTYYGRWTYKYEIAAEKGAAAAILVHETGPAGYPFAVVQGSWSRENFDIASLPDADASASAVEGWIDHATRPKQLLQGGRPGLRRPQGGRASTATSSRVPLGAKAEFARAAPRSRQVQSQNVVARLEGSDPQLKDEYVDLHGPLGPPGPRPDARRATRSTTARRQCVGRGGACSRSPGRSRRSSPGAASGRSSSSP